MQQDARAETRKNFTSPGPTEQFDNPGETAVLTPHPLYIRFHSGPKNPTSFTQEIVVPSTEITNIVIDLCVMVQAGDMEAKM